MPASADGIQQAIEYAEALRLPFVFSSNGDSFVFRQCLHRPGHAAALGPALADNAGGRRRRAAGPDL
jgi:type I site-specific restriction endonuclease